MRTEDELRQALSQAAQQAAIPATNARAAVGARVRRQRAVRLGAVAGMAVVIAVFALVSLTRPTHRASVRVVGPGPSPTAVAGPQPDTSSSPATSQSGTVPAGFSAVSVTFVSLNDGFVLGSAPCATPPCTVILRTTDGAKTWHRIGAPPVAAASDAAPGAVHSIRFATKDDGWVFGSELWGTHDGGQVWTEQPFGEPVGSEVRQPGNILDLEASAGIAHLVVLADQPDGARYEMWRAPTTGGAWDVSPLTIPKGAAPVADAQIVLQGKSGWVLINERTVYDGARLPPAGWVRWKPPCTEAFGSAFLMAPTPTHLAAVCQEGVWGGNMPPGIGVYLSDDAGATFSRAAKSVPSYGGAAASPVAGTVVVAGSLNDAKGELLATFDSGKSWSTVYRGTGVVTELGFTTPSQGIGIESDSDSRLSRLVMTTDGGHHWRAMPFGPTATADRRCTTGDLSLSLGEPPGEPTQQDSLTFALTNKSSSPCYLDGYPGVAFVADTVPMTLTYERSSDQVVTARKPVRVVLGPGDVAWVTVNQIRCTDQRFGATASEVRLIPPDERTALSLPLSLRRIYDCSEGDPGDVIHVSPVAATPQETVAH